MADTVQSIDDLIMCLVGMGFELEDCQEAVQSGKLTVEEAVEWLLSGKPKAPAATPASLRLGLFSNRLDDSCSLPQQTCGDSVQVETLSTVTHTSPWCDSLESEQCLQSRLHLSEKQQIIKDKFEEKERQQAQRTVKEEKRANKEARANILKQIEEDRKVISNRNIQTEPGPSSISVPSSALKLSPNSESACKIQVRLPNGDVIRNTYDAAIQFKEVSSWVKENVSSIEGLVLIQPYPKKIFSDADLSSTLKELQLFPSGSLVLKPIETSVNQGIESMDTDEPLSPSIADMPALALPPAFVGPGYRLDEYDQPDYDDNSSGGSSPPENLDGNLFPFMNAGPAMHEWGEGQILSPIDPRNPPSVPPDIASRYLDVAMPIPSTSNPQLVLSVQPLEQLCLKVVVKILCSPVEVSSLRLPANIAKNLLDILMKQKLLKPRMMNAFILCHLREIVLDCYPYVTNDFIFSLRYHANLSYLSMANCILFNNKGLQPLMALKKLNHLNLSGCKQLTDQCLEIIIEFKNLTHLNLENTMITDQGIILYLNSQPLHLENLVLNGTRITEAIWPALQCVPRLRSLSIEETQVKCLDGIEHSYLEALSLRAVPVYRSSFLSLQNHSSLTSLNIANIPTCNGDAILSLLKGLKLSTLKLPDRHTTTDCGIFHLQGLPLLSLDLTNYINVTDTGISHLKYITSLRHLHLSNTKLTDEGFKELQGLCHLELLYLDRTAITDDGATVITAFTKLRELDLASTRVTSKFLKEGVLNHCPMLTKLNLSRTHVKERGLRCLQLPHLSLLNLDGTPLRNDPKPILVGCPELKHISTRNLIPVSLDEDDEENE